jgi:glycosyltransferase involved in cell wall biosynthesis
MRIGILSDLHGWSWAGCEELWFALAISALAAGHQVDIFLNRTNLPPARLRDLTEKGARVHLPEGWPAIPDRIRTISWRLGNKTERFFRRFGKLAKLAPDILFISLGEPLPGEIFLQQITHSHILERPYAVVCHNSYLFGKPPADAHRTAAARFYRGARCAFFTAERTHREVEHVLAARIEPVHHVSNPVNMHDISAVPMPGGATLCIATVGRLANQSKGGDILLAALGRSVWRDRDWKLTFYGDGPHRHLLQVLAEHYGVDGRVTFGGYSNDVRAIWADNHLLALPSRNESSPLVLVEAMICGRPSVVTDVGGVCEWASEPETAFIAPGAHIDCYAEALERAWLARSDWPTIGARARERALQLMDPDPGGTALGHLIRAAKGA